MSTSASAIRRYSQWSGSISGSTSTGLDQVISWLGRDPGLGGSTDAPSLAAGIAAANALNQLITTGLAAIGRSSTLVLTPDDLIALNAWIRSDPARLQTFINAHGDDESGAETGFHRLVDNGASQLYQGKNLVNTVLDSVYHFGFQIDAAGNFLNEDGAANASLQAVAKRLSALRVDVATTNTQLDRSSEAILADAGLANQNPLAQIKGGAEAANGLNQLILAGLASVAAGTGSNPNRIEVSEVLAINAWIRNDQTRFNNFLVLHGDDENGEETGYHLVQNDGANTAQFGLNLVDTVLDGIYHIGFEIGTDGRFRNEDGNANARVADVADWLNYYLGDPSTTGSGLDRIVDTARWDGGLAAHTSAAQIRGGLDAANALNGLILKAVTATDVNLDGWISRGDLRQLSQWIQTNSYDDFLVLHGDDEGGVETGFHLIQGDGGNVQALGKALINTVADGIYHIGFAIDGDNFLNEDGNRNAALGDVSSWLNFYLNDRVQIVGTGSNDLLVGTDVAEQMVGREGNDLLEGAGGDDLLDGSWGDDTLLGGSGNDQLDGSYGNDWLNGGEGGDTYLVSGNEAGGWSSFAGFDTYNDKGTSGVDRILAVGPGDVDIGLNSFSASNGIERIEAAAGVGTVRLLGGWSGDNLDFSQIALVGGSFIIDGYYGNDTITGSSAADTIKGGGNDDRLNGAEGGDTYLVSGNEAGGWSSFAGFDTYNDTGTSGVDRILAVGPGDVDIGLNSFSAANGIERIEAGAGVGTVRLLGGWNGDSLDFSQIALVGGSFIIDGFYGNDSITGSSAADTIKGGGNDDRLNGAEGGDTYLVSGNEAGGWSSFAGFDTYNDTGSSGVDRILAVGPGDVDIGLNSFSAANGIERIEAAAGVGTVRLLGGWNGDTLDFSQIALVGGSFIIDGFYGNDSITGSSAADTIKGGGNDDRLIGGLGADLLNGGSGCDTFVFYSVAEIGLASGSYDIITDFASQLDKINLVNIDANLNVDSDQAFRYVGAAAFSGIAGELRLADQILSGDVNGDGLADFRLGLTGVSTLFSSTDLRL
jgi:Ca2+-binding RTX toxin-like protein